MILCCFKTWTNYRHQPTYKTSSKSKPKGTFCRGQKIKFSSDERMNHSSMDTKWKIKKRETIMIDDLVLLSDNSQNSGQTSIFIQCAMSSECRTVLHLSPLILNHNIL
jgi:hypothetical protein